MKLKFLPFCLLSFLSCWISPDAIAAPSVAIGPSSDGVYEVQGNDFSDASGIDITIRYDPAALASPQVVQGGLVGGALMAVNTSTSGKIRLALIRVTAINGSGTIATITFTRVKSTGADIQSVVSSAINTSGKNIARYFAGGEFREDGRQWRFDRAANRATDRRSFFVASPEYSGYNSNGAGLRHSCCNIDVAGPEYYGSISNSSNGNSRCGGSISGCIPIRHQERNFCNGPACSRYAAAGKRKNCSTGTGKGRTGGKAGRTDPWNGKEEGHGLSERSGKVQGI